MSDEVIEEILVPDTMIRASHNNEGLSQRTIFHNIKENKIIFCIDTSGSMYHCLDVVKEQVIESLKQFSNRSKSENNAAKFNLIEFSTEVTKWSDRMVNCTEDTVSVAAEWIKSLSPKTGTDTLSALLCALGEEECESVYLITDGIPDRNIDHVIEEVLHAVKNRPIHCYYIHDQEIDDATVDFLKQLATETYGSLDIVKVKSHGPVERITPLYSADMGEKIVRSTDGNVYPANQKFCSVSATLDDLQLLKAFQAHQIPQIRKSLNPYSLSVPPYPYCMLPWPYRYYHYFSEPPNGILGWSRYRPAMSWLKHANDFVSRMTNLAPGAGAMLINTKILAKRYADGFFYPGTTKSQILENKFLVELDACKHGRHQSNEYQETFVHDIVSLTDALRHPVLTDGKVLAPCEPEGERYAPGVVISGQEKRMAEGDIDEKSLVVTFYNGKTVTIERNKAIWVPRDLHDRITYELQLSKNLRQELSQQESNINFPGYPPIKAPADYDPHPFTGLMESSPYLRNGSVRSSVNGISSSTYKMAYSDGKYPYRKDARGAGNDYNELSEKVREQILRNRSFLDNGCEQNECVKSSGDCRCKSDGNELRKSVSFADKLSVVGDDYEDRLLDSGIVGDICVSDSEYDVAILGDKEEIGQKKVYRRRVAKTKSPQPWRYWNNDPAPSLHDPLHFGPYRKGAYRPQPGSPTFLLKESNRNSIDWRSPFYQYSDPYALYKSGPTVEDCLKMPRAPLYKPPRQLPGRDISVVLGEHQLPQEMIADARREYKQGQVLKREITLHKRQIDEERSQQRAVDQRRQEASYRLQKETERRSEQTRKDENHLAGIRLGRQAQLEAEQKNYRTLADREQNRINAKIQEKENRTMKAEQIKQDENLKWARVQAGKELAAQHRLEEKVARVVEAEAVEARRFEAKQRSTAQVTTYYRQKEAEAQKYKVMNAEMKDRNLALYRSQVLP